MERITVDLSMDNLDPETESILEKAHLDVKIESILEKAKMARVQATSDISANIRQMINNRDYSDIVFHCKDGVQVHASRLFLVARSEVFQRMLSNGMAESHLSKITLHEISSTALLPVMEFLYTGTLQEHAPRGWENAYEILFASRFFLLEGFELIVMDYLLQAARKVKENIEEAAKFLSLTVQFVDVLGEKVELIARDLVCILRSRSLKPEHLQALTSDAFMYFLKKTETKTAEPILLSHGEFLRLKNIILWCACKDSAPKDEFLCTLVLLEASPNQRKAIVFDKHVRYWHEKVKGKLALSVKEYLPLVNLKQIPPELLLHIFDPMGILPSSDINDALRFHTLGTFCNIGEDNNWSTSFKNTLPFGWSTTSKNKEMYSMARNGSIIKQMVPGIGFARYSFAMDRGGTYEWLIIIEKACDGFIEIGLHYVLDTATPSGNFNAVGGYNLPGQVLPRQPGSLSGNFNALGGCNLPRQVLPRQPGSLSGNFNALGGCNLPRQVLPRQPGSLSLPMQPGGSSFNFNPVGGLSLWQPGASSFNFNPVDGLSLSRQPGGWALRMDPRGLTINQTANRAAKPPAQHTNQFFAPYGKNCTNLVYGKHFAHENCKVKVCLDRLNHRCSFVIDNEDFGVAWTQIPSGTFYPAVSLGSGCGGRVQIRILRAS